VLFKTGYSNLGKKTGYLAVASIILTIIAFFSSPFLRSFILIISLLGLAATLGIVALIIILKSKKPVPGLKRAILGTVLSLSLLAYAIIGSYTHALRDAIERGDVQAIKNLASKGYDVNATTSGTGRNMLTLCFRYGLQKISPFSDTRQISLMTREEVESKILEMLDVLIDNGADINAQDPMGNTPLNYAASSGHIRIVEMLIAGGADVNLAGRFGDRPLHNAVHSGNPHMVRMIIEKGADINLTGRNGWTPLQLAIKTDRQDIADLLKQHGAKK
jgi:hypothetical protein